MNKEELKKVLQEEKKYYPCMSSLITIVYGWLCQERDYYTYRFIYNLRKEEYFSQKKENSFFYRVCYIFYKRQKNRLGKRMNLDIGENVFEPGLFIAHTNIIVGSAHVGKNCKLHGQNCIGSGAVIGDNCELWVGAKVFGPSRLADNITVAAGAVVVNSFDEEGITVGGVPARKIK